MTYLVDIVVEEETFQIELPPGQWLAVRPRSYTGFVEIKPYTAGVINYDDIPTEQVVTVPARLVREFLLEFNTDPNYGRFLP